MKIAIMGIRGIPANYGGFETFAEEVAPRLAQKGHDVTVYGRSNNIKFNGKYYKGVRIIILPTIPHKYLDTVAHTFLCALHSMKENYDAILICNSANSLFAFIPRLTGQKIALNVDGLEWKRKKWNKLGQWYYKFSEYIATLSPNVVVTDARTIQKYYLEKFNKPSVYIPYGSPVDRVTTKKILDKFGVKPRKYVLYVSRLEPENNAHLVIKAFEQVQTDLNLVIVGDAPYSSEYIAELKKTKDPRIIFTGYVFGEGYREFQSHAYIYIQATEVGGTHPALLEAMGHGNCVLANDVPEHREVLGDAGFYFSTHPPNHLRDQIQYLLDHPEVVEEKRGEAVERIKQFYTWEKVTDGYEKLFYEMINGSAEINKQPEMESICEET
ncbi:MAG: glycosyltransferase family 1 protein [Calditrichaeota bacterium]|nr:MAG: glycosyltransferase family 1 protein [Calditrichota bacterium]